MTPRGQISLGILLSALVAVLALTAGGYGAYTLYQNLTTTTTKLASSTLELASTTLELQKTEADKQALADALTAEQAKNGDYQNQISTIATTVGTLTKLSQTDKELLEKYSKVYFLNENYIPSSLSDIDEQYALDPKRTYEIHAEVKPFLEHMLSDAADAGAPLLVLSSYRSFGDQTALKISYKVTYGAGANKFSADQGYSEHQLGTAVDLTTKELGTTAISFATTPGGKWLSENAYKYGFILSYPSGNAYYQYEPWHWRFVGVALATYLHDHDAHFYDADQRFIDTYLANIFDQ